MGAAAVSSMPTRTVLVVDDEQVVRTVLRRFFVRRGWSVAEAESAEQALEMLALDPLPELVVCDLNLPGMSGSVFCRRVVALHPVLATRLVLTSGDPLAAAAALERDSLHCPLLAKPFTLGDLDRLLDAVMRAA
jgi:CheY-like chemotaxis protein